MEQLPLQLRGMNERLKATFAGQPNIKTPYGSLKFLPESSLAGHHRH